MTRRDALRLVTGTAVLAFMPATVARLAARNNLSAAALREALDKIWYQFDRSQGPLVLAPVRLMLYHGGEIVLKRIAQEEMYEAPSVFVR